MINVKTIAELQQLRDEMQQKMNIRKTDDSKIRVVVGMATCGIAAGARPVLTALVEETGKRKLSNIVVTQTGCIGVCRLEPIVEVFEPGREKVTYVKMTAEKALRIVSEHLANGRVVEDYTIGAAD